MSGGRDVFWIPAAVSLTASPSSGFKLVLFPFVPVGRQGPLWLSLSCHRTQCDSPSQAEGATVTCGSLLLPSRSPRGSGVSLSSSRALSQALCPLCWADL